jgi:hypothetical protein
MNQPEFIIEFNTAPTLNNNELENYKKNKDNETKTCYGCRRLDNNKFNECICYNICKINNKDLEKQIIRYNLKDKQFNNKELIIETVYNNLSLFNDEFNLTINEINDHQFIIDNMTFYILNYKRMVKKINRQFEDDINKFEPHFLCENIRTYIYKKEIEEYEEDVDDDDIELPDPDIKYELDECPICMDTIEDKTYGECGHCLCFECFNKICHSDNAVCPSCRDVWDYYAPITKTREIEVNYTLDDIYQLWEDKDFDTLYEVIDVEGLISDVLDFDMEGDVLGYLCEYNGDSRWVVAPEISY